jgi:uncharacterized protein
VKNIAELYELWCFFRVVREMEAVLGPATAAERPRAKDLRLEVPWDFRVTWAGRAYLDYNRRFGRSRTRQSTSYSVPLRPDITLEVLSGPTAGIHLLDAKFRLERVAGGVTGVGPGGEVLACGAEDDAWSSFKPADLHKMHTYRDAICDARTAWVLYPGTRYRFFVPPETGTGVEGVGAVPLQPAARGG